MIAFIEKLNSEVLRSIERIESRDTDVLKKSLEASRVLGEAFDRLKQYIIGYRFQNDDEEIKFFKEIKPRLFCRLIPHLADKLFQLRSAVVDQAVSGYPCLALLDFGRIVFSHCCSGL